MIYNKTQNIFRWKRVEPLETDSITEYDLPNEDGFGAAEEIVKISEKKSNFDAKTDDLSCEGKEKDNPALELEEDPHPPEKCSLTV